jgi:hypothetical protein
MVHPQLVPLAAWHATNLVDCISSHQAPARLQSPDGLMDMPLALYRRLQSGWLRRMGKFALL